MERIITEINVTWCRVPYPDVVRMVGSCHGNGILPPDKHGCQPEESVELAHRITEDCKHLTFCGLMTIGRVRHLPGPNPDFLVLPITFTLVLHIV